MAKINWGVIIALGVLGGIAYYLWKGGNFFGIFGGGDETGNDGAYFPTFPTVPTVPTEPTPEPFSPPVVVPLPNVLPPGKTLPPNYFIKYTPEQIQDIHNAAGTTQAWTKVTYGSPGQPSLTFAQRTLKQAQPYTVGIGKVMPAVSVKTPSQAQITVYKPLAVSKGAPVVTVVKPTITAQRTALAASAIKAGAPPRVVAKIKGGSWY